MISLYVAGQKVGTLQDSGKLVADFIARRVPVEFRDDAGELLGSFMPNPQSTQAEPLVPWDPTITKEELDRRLAGEFITFDELKKRMGWE